MSKPKKVDLRVDGGMPLSWRSEDIKDERGRTIKARCVGRRVWGKDIAEAIFVIESDGADLALRDPRDGMRVVQRWPHQKGYDSPWGGDGLSRLRQVAEWHEEQAFNATLDLLSIERTEVAS